MIKAIVFDCFGVLATDGWLPFKKKYFGTDQKLWEEASDLNKLADSGLISYHDFVLAIAKTAKVSEEMALNYIEHNVPNEELFAYIKTELKPKYRIGMLSNAGDNWLDEIFSKDQVELFDKAVLSYETGIVKPDPRAYQMIAERLDTETHECVFIDDQERYCTAARDVSMQTIVYESLEQMRPELEKILQRDL